MSCLFSDLAAPGSVGVRGSNPLSSTTFSQFKGINESYVRIDVTLHVTSVVVASIHAQKNSTGNTYRVLWRDDGRQRSLTFENLPSAERFKTLLADHGPDEALRVIELDEVGKHVPTVTEWLYTHIDTLTGVQPATLARYRTYVRRDIDPVFGSMPVSAVTETTIARWIKQLGGSGKTIANKHGFVSGAFQAAVRARVMASNPCQGRRLPHTRVEETVFLTPAEFVLLRENIERQRWKDLATWLVSTGMRFSEATALTAADIDAEARTCRINKAWKYSGDYRPEIGPPKTKKSIRTISLPPAALEVLDLTAPRFLSPTAPGTPFVRRNSSTAAGSQVERAP
jgi:integrase